MVNKDYNKYITKGKGSNMEFDFDNTATYRTL